jgi:hypothetical protein
MCLFWSGLVACCSLRPLVCWPYLFFFRLLDLLELSDSFARHIAGVGLLLLFLFFLPKGTID